MEDTKTSWQLIFSILLKNSNYTTAYETLNKADGIDTRVREV